MQQYSSLSVEVSGDPRSLMFTPAFDKKQDRHFSLFHFFLLALYPSPLFTFSNH